MVFIKSLLLFASILFLVSCNQSNDVELIEHPNVLFISLDDMNDWVEPLAGNNKAIC
jgi:hypothetical protein